ncbi:hydroxyacylglutathione hydrolase [Thiomicrorhabdus immobilis]|uniref:Hydroxyacylglutathione hydrolase n=1 Tax=Thiomicrorhabdus immobilis TaxID=2791037 RepID=A0ABN6CX97_9GAMM|nr:hydroxyacylglutathione hydrolase [Thiomicrorhabdus immobilis]BCN93573.1 hydroxyacylglutathione hydrolase [Thiomicrorhabdus immobilis]
MNIVGLPALVGTYDNYIWVIHNSENAWIVDPGESQQVLDYLNQHNLQLQAILITHQHFDHIDGIADLHNAYPNAQVFGPAKSTHPSIQIKCKENDVITLADELQLKVLETPGHTLDHIAFYNDSVLFCGDTLFTAGCGRILGGTAQQFSDSILKLRQLPDELKFFSAHEYTLSNLGFAAIAEPENAALKQRIATTEIHYPSNHTGAQSTLGEEKATNPFLRFDTPHLKKSLLERGAEDSAESLFATLRAWKDEYDRNH